MKAAEILERLEAARIAITALPKDTEILTVQVDGCGKNRHNSSPEGYRDFDRSS